MRGTSALSNLTIWSRSHDAMTDLLQFTLRAMLSCTKDAVAVVGRQDFSVLLTDSMDDLSKLDSVEDFTESTLRGFAGIAWLMKMAAQTTGIKTTAFVFLDQATADDETTCRIAIDARQDEDSMGWLSFRCEFPSIVPAVEAIERGYAATELRNQSAMAGGVWRDDRVKAQLARASSLKLSSFPCHKDWRPVFVDGADLQYTVFRTAKISTDVLNKFLKQAYDHDWSSDIDPRVAFITKLSPPFTDGLADPPLTVAPDLPESFNGAKPCECDAVVRSCFMDESLSPKLDRHRFIIMDEFTEAEETVIMALNFERNGQLILVRSDFKDAFLTLMAPGTTGAGMEIFADSASRSPLGVLRSKTQ
ncbi:hypothetical protein JX265_005675 [Neoarthrinium moseri]|uniref:Uncharacterized protein n=1 Tax=Neoarthrinium moseri TaxID=1658444 RepID=A0A9P9WN18_9PEZI|nr:hypothetical protein JX266_005557 [Neoarthrinium moseri]KAI1871689.1 hypothetical protein JX265_005675 [Neoarthrinium moseri]